MNLGGFWGFASLSKSDGKNLSQKQIQAGHMAHVQGHHMLGLSTHITYTQKYKWIIL
jgi:hypothetical protein